MKSNLLTKIMCLSFLLISTSLPINALDDKGKEGSELFVIQKTISATILESTDKNQLVNKYIF